MSTVFHVSWNLGGVLLEKGISGLEELERLQKRSLDVASLQEVPRGSPGWSFEESQKMACSLL